MTQKEYNKQVLKLNEFLKNANNEEKKEIYRKIFALNEKYKKKEINQIRERQK